MVSDGLTPPTVGIDHALARAAAHSRRAVHVAGVVGLAPDVGRVNGLQRLGHEVQRMVDQPSVVVAPGIFDAGDRQSVLILVVCKTDPVARLWHHLTNDLQADLVVVVLHRRHQRRAPQTT
jgi:hypothetical protein